MPSSPRAPRGVLGTLFDRLVEVSHWVQVRLLFYVAAASATVLGLWKLLGQKSDGFGPGDWQFWVGVAVAVLPAAAVLVGFVIPEWSARRRRRRLADWSVSGDAGRPGHFRLAPYSEQDRDTFTRADQAHAEALRWVRGCPDRVLYLTGVSGSGKSSVLAAHVIPELRADALVIPLRSSDDPVGRLRAVLLAPGAVWKEAQAKKHEGADPTSLVRAASEYLGRSGTGLLLVVDQFEEALVSQDAAGVLDVLKAVAGGGCAGSRAVLSLRIEFLGDLSRAGLPPPSVERNCFTVPPFTEAAARTFLAAGFDEMGAHLLDRVLAEAVVLDNLSGRVRPVTLNMVGQMLRRMPATTGRVSVGNRPFAAYVRSMLAENDVRDHAPGILRALLDGQNRRLHKTVQELAGPGGDPHAVDGCLGRLSIPDRGLVRCLNPGERDVSRRRWEVSHDFVAAVLGGVLPGLRPTGWSRARRWLPAAALVVWAVTLFVLLPRELASRKAVERDETTTRLRDEFGLMVVSENPDGSLEVALSPRVPPPPLSGAIPLLAKRGRPVYLNATENPYLKDGEWVGGLSGLRVVWMFECKRVSSLNGLQRLPHLEQLYCYDCPELVSVEALRGLTALRTLSLARCPKLVSVEPLRGLTGLETLDLTGCTSLTSQDIEQLKGSLRTTQIQGP
jgi:hypothetical protein